MDGAAEVFGQRAARVRCEWGLTGAEAIAGEPGRTAVVVVDVLSFTTSVSIACDRGMVVYPFRWRDDRARAYADERRAVLAEARSERNVSLSPTSSSTAEGVERIVLPSPNGATLSLTLGERGHRVVAGGLRNASAVGRWCAGFLDDDPRNVVAVVPAGERWAVDGSLRPAAEDLWGAGAVMRSLDPALLSGEARVAVRSFVDVGDLRAALRDCVSGRELIAEGFASDVDLAAELDATSHVPVLSQGAFKPGAAR